MRLDIDQGNTRIKWRLSDSQVTLAHGSLANTAVDWQGWLRQIDEIVASNDAINVVAIASVAKPEYRNKLVEFCQRQLQLTPVMAASAAGFDDGKVKLTNSYPEPSKMGVDRWYAMLGAVCEFPGRGIVIADAGSAINIEVVDPDGRHLGGYIVPGMEMMKSSLRVNTGAVSFDELERAEFIEPGRNTAEAVCNGIANAALGLIGRSCEYAREIWQNSEFELILTGGDAVHLLPFLNDARYRPELILDGLAYALKPEINHKLKNE